MKLDQLAFPVCISHRGVKQLYPENTLISFQTALEAKTQMIEFDVALSKDRIPVVIHDDTLDRTTNGSGKVNEFTLAELKALDAGSWFDPRFKGERIPTLEEVLNIIGTSALINIEIKDEYYEPANPPDAIEKQVLGQIMAKGIRSSVLVSSFEMRILDRLRKQDQQLALAFITKNPDNPLLLNHCRNLRLYSYNPWFGVVNQELVASLHQSGIRVFVFTINQREEFEKALELEVDGVFTDNQPYFDKFLGSRRQS